MSTVANQWKKLEAGFVKQKDGYSCGAIAIVNTLRAFGIKESLTNVKKTLRIEKHKGTYFSWFEIGLNKYFKDFEIKKQRATLSKINEEIKKGPIMFFYIPPENDVDGSHDAHVATILFKHGKQYVVCNMTNNETLSIVPESYVKKCLQGKDHEFPVIYRVTQFQTN